jgi:hypothetical protein
VVLKTAKGGDQ